MRIANTLANTGLVSITKLDSAFVINRQFPPSRAEVHFLSPGGIDWETGVLDHLIYSPANTQFSFSTVIVDGTRGFATSMFRTKRATFTLK